jgi:hypothetical protein
MNLVKSVGTKLDAKLKAGDMKESELLAEASELMKKMKDMPGMGNIQSMLNKMGMGGGAGSGVGGGGGKNKVNVSAMQANLERNLKNAKNKERLLSKLAEKKAEAAAVAAKEAVAAVSQGTGTGTHNATTNLAEMENLIFSTGEKAERSTIRPEPKKKNKKNKKK